MSWARLVRLPAVFTVIAQVIAAFLLVNGTPQPVARMIVVILSAIALYWSGMIFNDLWDIDEDIRERPTRPLPSGEIKFSAARSAAWGLMIAGIVLATLSGLIPATELGITLCPAIIGVAIAGCVLLYNGPLKNTLLAPVVMGLCRSLCFLLGAAPMVTVGIANVSDVTSWFPTHIVGAAIGMGIYIMGITVISSGETIGGQRLPIIIGTLIVVVGAICMAISPMFAPPENVWQLSFEGRFPWLIGLIAFSIVLRGIRVAIHPEVPAIQNLVRIGVLTLIPLSAAFAVLAAGPMWGLSIFALVVPSMCLATRIRVT